MACIYIGNNKTYELMIESWCPRQYKCIYNPWGKEPNIDDVIDSLNNEKYFTHVSGLIDTIVENDKVSFELERGMRGMNAVKVTKI